MKRWLSFILLTACLVACGPAPATQPIAVVDTGVDPDQWALVPEGDFLYGMHEHPATIEKAYEMMITDVTHAQYASYLNLALAAEMVKFVDQQVVGYYPGDPFSGKKHEEEITAGDWLHLSLAEPGLRLTFDGEQFSAVPGYENHPMVMVTWFGARAYCMFFSGRLPSEVEWEKAARGEDNRPYPWGEGIARNQANYYSSHDLFEKMVGGLGDTTPVGYYNGKTYDTYPTVDGASPYGLYDMAGNVWQWVGDVYPGIHYRYLRGGSKIDYAYNLRIWTRNNASPDYYSPSVAFRCARDPVPVVKK